MTAESPFLELLRSGVDKGGFETDDVLATILPLFRQTATAHEQEKVGPLKGLEKLLVNGEQRLGFDSEAAEMPKYNPAKLEELQRAPLAALDVIGEARDDTDVETGSQRTTPLEIGNPDEAVTKPVFLGDYQSWESAAGHHDPLTDIFLLGQLLASLACGLDLTDPEDLELFVRHRKNLFALNQRLNPVLSTVIVEMTELNRHRRVQDLPSVIRRLETYRDQPADLDLNRIPGLKESNLSGRRKIIQSHLRDRLFDVSRRNRLIHFKTTLSSLNLTVASVPLLLDYRNIRLEQLFVWHPALAKEITDGAALSLAKYLRFEDAPYIPGVLDKIISEARRDRAEFGFSQLRLVLCFLRWHNLKEFPEERIHSPLLLLPVELSKKKGVRDSYMLTPGSSEAVVNPALRHYLKHLYNLDLPEAVDLRETTLDAFHDQLQKMIRASEPAVTLQKIDRPQIELIHARARQRVDQYKRRLKPKDVRGRTVASRDYSYERGDFRPLGLKLFRDRIQPSPAPMRDIAGAPPSPRLPNIREAEDSKGAESGEVHEIKREMFSLREGEQQGSGNPYLWEFDLCSLTLGNFNYRKMTLVRDYSNLTDSDHASEAFDRIFSLDPKAPEDQAREALPLVEQFLVVPSDATQVSAIARARSGKSYIIQGPPGTGKSQTITNLIADYVAQGKRVLFVCEKRAAIDVVFHRLRQQGLDELCCLIHDSQTDKKAFIHNLKQTSEAWLGQAGGREDAEKVRTGTLRKIESELENLKVFSEAMVAERETSGVPLRLLLERLVELRASVMALSPVEEELLPGYREWVEHGETVNRLGATLKELGGEPCFARHPFRYLNLEMVQRDQPLQALLSGLDKAEALLEEVQDGLAASGLPEEMWGTVAEIEAILEFVARLRPLAGRELLPLLDPNSAASARFVAGLKELEAKGQLRREAGEKTKNWRDKLPLAEAELALAQTEKLEGSFLSFLNPAWWRLRRVLNARYNFDQHAVRPEWSQVLKDLIVEWRAAAEEKEARDALGREFGTEDPHKLREELTELRGGDFKAPESIAEIRKVLLSSPDGSKIVERLCALQPRFGKLIAEISQLIEEFQEFDFSLLGEAIRDMRESADEFPELLPVLTEMAELPEELREPLRELPLAPEQFEAAIGQKTMTEIFRDDRALSRFDGRALARRMGALEKHYRGWLDHNAAVIRARVRRKFLEHAQIASSPGGQLSEEQKVFKKNYAAGRRELEHEFGKSMRYKSIRELAGGNSGEVVRDLKPIWLMSPLSVSDTLPLDARLFDVVIFDEASQIPVEEAIPALYRAQQVIVVGDEMQLPPTSFFSTSREGEDDLVVEEEGEKVEVSLDADSFLTQSGKNLPSTLLAWHYRSRYEALISFSNAAFYGGNLFTIPDRQLPAPGLGEILVSEPVEGAQNAEAALGRSISFHFFEKGIYENRRNPSEAEYIAHLVRELLQRETKLSIGIVAFSEAQQTEIEDALDRLAEEDDEFAGRLESEFTREEEDQFCGLFVKNLENVQGDERDLIILSICYGYDEKRRMIMNFGPINQRGGEKRLNVIFSRAKKHMAVVSSIRHHDITNEFNDGANALKNFLHYAEAVSKGDLETARRVLENLNPLNRKSLAPRLATNTVAESLRDRLQGEGLIVDLDVGQSRFRCDLAVRKEGEAFYQLGILLDTEVHYSNPNLVERYLTQPSTLKGFGWRVMMVLTKDWCNDPDRVVQRIERALGEGGEEELPEEAEEPIAAPSPETDEGSKKAVLEPASATGAVSAAGKKRVRRLEFKSGGSRKFWEITQEQERFTVRYGRIGTEGQVHTKSYVDQARAQWEADKLVAEKLKKGYVEV